MRIGFIGLGTMGRHMAAHLQDAGHDLIVNDILQVAAASHLEQGAIWAPTPAAVMAQSEVVFTSLPMPRDVEAVALGKSGLVESLKKGKIYIDLSTNSLSVVRAIHDAFAQAGTEMLDAPISGGQSGAESGKLAFYVGGREPIFKACEHLFATMGDQVTYVGNSGSGTIVKLVHNLASQAMSAAFAEAMTLGVRAGVEPLRLWSALRRGSAGRRRSFDLPRYLTGDHSVASFRLGLAHKDVLLATEMAREMGFPMRVSEAAFADLAEAVRLGWQDQDSSAIMMLQQQRSDVRIQLSAEAIRTELSS